MSNSSFWISILALRFFLAGSDDNIGTKLLQNMSSASSLREFSFCKQLTMAWSNELLEAWPFWERSLIAGVCFLFKSGVLVLHSDCCVVHVKLSSKSPLSSGWNCWREKLLCVALFDTTSLMNCISLKNLHCGKSFTPAPDLVSKSLFFKHFEKPSLRFLSLE